jgi:hypothetical protein
MRYVFRTLRNKIVHRTTQGTNPEAELPAVGSKSKELEAES